MTTPLPALVATDLPLASARAGRSLAGAAGRALLTSQALLTSMGLPMSLPVQKPAAERDPSVLAARDQRLAALVAAAAAGDAGAFEAFYDATAGYARALARRMLHGPDIDDLLADAYFEAWRLAKRFDATRASAVTWLLTIVRSRALDLLRRQAASPSVGAAPADDPALERPSEEPGPAERLWQAQAGSHLHAALRNLGSAERWVLGLAYFQDLSHSAIAATTGMPLGTVKSLILRAQSKLRTELTH